MLAALVWVTAAVGPVASQTTLPVLWTAGGLDAGSTGAGQAARMSVDSVGNVAIVSGGAGTVSLTVTSYTPSGTLRWRQSIRPNSGSFAGDWVASAANGDVVALGHNVDSRGQSSQLTLVRYAGDGTFLWRVDRLTPILGVARLVVDTAGDAYVAYNSQVEKYTAAGVLLWARTMAAGMAASLALAPGESDVVVVGSVRGGATWVTQSLDAATGTPIWAVTATEGIGALDVVVDPTRVYVTGQGNVGTTGFLTVIAYDRSTGARLWRTDSTPPNAQSVGQRLALAPDGGLVATGYTSAGGYRDWWTVAMDTTGVVRWQARRDRAATGDEFAGAVFVLQDGTAVVSGTGGPTVTDALGNSYMQGVTAGYGPTGVLLWEAYSKLPAVWAAPLPSGDLCATGGYDALVTCWRLAVAGPPAAPSNLTARLSAGAIQLAWLDNSSNETAFIVERSEYTGSSWPPFEVVATLAAGTTSYADTVFTATSYQYRVRASNSAGSSAYSNSATIDIVSANAPPIAVMSVTPTSGPAPLTVRFDGSGSSDLEGPVAGWTWTFGDGTGGSGVTTMHVYQTPGTYTATLRVTDGLGLDSFPKTATIVVTAPVPPTAPSGLTATALPARSIRLGWTNTTTNQTDVHIERCTGSGCTNFVQVASVAGAATTFTDTGLKSRTTYAYRIRAHNAAGDSPYSNVASARTTR